MLLAAHAVSVLAAGVERVAVERLVAEREPVQAHRLLRDLEQPDALDALGVPVKYLSTNALLRPTASKICAPQYDW